ncbi:hypothetical protein P4493_05985 [Bacillus thuringiensis]|jgi:hypothetical protein|uniref:Uncharacterized protein n=3 Tax=Bacillus thuringiensis TaxID=1428 RepID=A0A0B5NC61_BACTU|nr:MULTISPECIES: hypothetical protein [Bacillus]EAO55620.1 hypothetical protein RBTH_06756 [Bacillus thuringiensis serovar israelensis ATCC 35646]MEC2533113.1 hypothetical protein [Bacillus cereus]MED1153907.1 hypothetical protein [Bacillus paranthracis]OUB09249.1 hypothetical protein BK708_32460 [Bacillus thuringiensis serovar yunnanensis]AFQ30215.1 hypothetical protein BTF1_30572 [Bacillus thuringiensis HD-789]
MTDELVQEEDLCFDCKKPAKERYSEVETPGDMVWCEGIFHEESRLIHHNCLNYYDEDWYCKECYGNLKRCTELTVQYTHRPKYDSHQFDLVTKEFDMFKEDQAFHHLYASFASEHRMQDWCNLIGLDLEVYKENPLRLQYFRIVTFDDIKDVPKLALNLKCHAIDKNIDTIFYCYMIKTDYSTIIFRPTNPKDMVSANVDRKQLEPFYQTPFVGKFK